jgi:hypothetical protein
LPASKLSLGRILTLYFSQQVARKKFVDDFSILAVEKCLLEPLAVIFCPQIVDTLADDVVENIAAEDESSKLERGRLQHKRTKLYKSLLQLHRLDRLNVSGEICTHDLANLRLSKCIVPKGSDESLHLEDDSPGSEPDETDDVGSLTESPVLATSEAAYEPEVVEVPRFEKKKKHPNASLWEW